MTITSRPDEFYDEWWEWFYDKKILVEGDSWVSHPQMANLGDWFHRTNPNGNLVLNLGVPGDNAGSVYGDSDAVFRAGGPQMKKLKRLMNTLQWGDRFDLIFISAAGNDIIGPEIKDIPLVKNKRRPQNRGLYGRELIHENFYKKLNHVIEGYRRFLSMRESGLLNRRTPIITHTYAYLKPRKVGTRFFGIKFNDGWIADYLEQQGIDDKDEQYEILVEMFDRYHQRISALQNEFSKFLVVDTRKTLLKNGKPNTRWFHDEIHPTTEGFRRVFNKIRTEARRAGMWTLDT